MWRDHIFLSESKIQLYLNEIVLEGECISGNQKISEIISLPTTVAAFPIEIQLKDIIANNGLLKQVDDELSIELQKFDGLKITRTSVKRIEKQMIWGSFNSELQVAVETVQSYLNGLSQENTHESGDYGYFYIDHNDLIHLSSESYGNDFLISTDESFKEIQNRIAELKLDFPGLQFEATNYNGSTINIQ